MNASDRPRPGDKVTALDVARAAGVSQSAVSRVFVIGTQFLLMWLLLPEHFGAFALVQSVTMFANHLTNPGIDDVLLQKDKHIHRWTSAAFWPPSQLTL